MSLRRAKIVFQRMTEQTVTLHMLKYKFVWQENNNSINQFIHPSIHQLIENVRDLKIQPAPTHLP